MSYPDPYVKGFMDCLASEKKGVFVRHIFIDINDGKLSDAVFFSQCAFVFAQLNEGGYRHYSLIDHQGEFWISISYAQWWDTCRLNKSTVRAVLKRVCDRGLIIAGTIRENNSPRTILRINYAKFADALHQENEKKQVIESVTSPDRFDHTTRSNQSPASDRISHLQVIESVTSPDRFDHVSISKEYLEELEKRSRRDPQDPECAIEDVKICQVEICLEPEPIEASQPLALDQTGNNPTVKRSKKGEDKSSAPGAVALVSPAAAEMPVEVDTPTTVCDGIGDGGYERFRAKYTKLCVDVHRKFGKSEDAKKAWKVAWKGLEPPDRFWFGLDCYIEQQQAEYAKTGECWMVGAKRFLDADEVHWESAIRKHEVSQKTQSFGVDIDSPSSMKRANIVSSNQKNWAIARQQLIAEGRAV